MEHEGLVVTREAQESDRSFVVSNWIKSQYYGSPHWSQMDYTDFREHYAPIIAAMLLDSRVDVAVLEDAPELILAFLVYKGTTIHWAYTKKDYRSKGLLNLLLKNKAFTTVTSTTLPGNAIRKKKKLKFNPFEV